MKSAPDPCYWLASYPKSGNTWVRMLLAAYKSGALDINANSNVTQYDCDNYTWNSLSPVPLSHVNAETAVFLRPAVLLHLLYSRKSRPTIIKTHNARMRAAGVELIPPELTAGAVYLVRDPRDVVSSFARHLGKTVDEAITSMAEEYNKLVLPEVAIASWLTTWSHHARTWMKEDVTVVRYEDLKTHTEEQFIRILHGLRLKVNLPRVRKAIRLCNIEALKRQEQKAGFIEKGVQDKFFGQGKGWREELTEKQARRIEEDHGEMMRELRYL